MNYWTSILTTHVARPSVKDLLDHVCPPRERPAAQALTAQQFDQQPQQKHQPQVRIIYNQRY